GVRRRGRRLFRQPSPRQPAGRVGVEAVGNAGRARDLRGAAGEGRGRVRRARGAAPAALERVPGGAPRGRVLVRRAISPARALAVRARCGWGLVEADAVSVSLLPVGPRRIVCLTEEPTEVLYALGEQDRIVGISGFTVRPPQARREK